MKTVVVTKRKELSGVQKLVIAIQLSFIFSLLMTLGSVLIFS